jgi:hypothetical protein
MFRCVSIVGFLSAVCAAFQFNSCSAQGFVPRSMSVSRATRDYIVNRPTVSPYLNLTRRTSQFAPPNYQTLVRPALERRAREAQQSATMRRLQSDVLSLQGQMELGRSRQSGQFASGHPTGFFAYMHYYPGLQRNLGRRR